MRQTYCIFAGNSFYVDDAGSIVMHEVNDVRWTKFNLTEQFYDFIEAIIIEKITPDAPIFRYPNLNCAYISGNYFDRKILDWIWIQFENKM